MWPASQHVHAQQIGGKRNAIAPPLRHVVSCKIKFQSQTSCRRVMQAQQEQYLYASSAAETRSTAASGRSKRARIAAGSMAADGGRLPGSEGAGIAPRRATASSCSLAGITRPSSAAQNASANFITPQYSCKALCSIGCCHSARTVCVGGTWQFSMLAPGCVCSR